MSDIAKIGWVIALSIAGYYAKTPEGWSFGAFFGYLLLIGFCIACIKGFLNLGN